MIVLNASWLWLFLALVYMYYKRPSRSPKIIYMYLSLSMVIIALARPVFHQQVVEVETKGSDVIVALDISYSMQADDIAPNRLIAAKSFLKSLVKRDVNDRFGVLAYTTNAIILSPLTHDSELLINLAERIDENMVITKGTSLMNALQLARKMSRSEHPKLILLTDGGDAQSYEKEALYAKENALQVNVVMFATAFGATLKLSDGTLLKDAEGNIVVSTQNRAIKTLCDATSGEYFATPDLSGMIGALKSQYNEDFKGKSEIVTYSELFYLFIILAIVFFMLAYTTLREKLHHKITLLLVMLGISSHAGILDFYYLSQAQEAYKSGIYEKAARYFSEVENSKAQYNAAVANYKEGNYEAALSGFESIKSANVNEKASFYYNSALCYIRLKEFDKARENLIKSLTLKFDAEAYANYLYIKDATHHEMITGQQEGKKRAQSVNAESSQASKKRKEGGGSNMNVSADASNSAGDAKMKTRSESMLSFSKNGAKLSSSQYELINERSVNETTPW